MQLKAALLTCVAFSVACGKSEETSSSKPQSRSVMVKLSGHVAALPVPPVATTSDFANVTVNIVNPAVLMFDPTRVAPLASLPLEQDDTTTCTSKACSFAMDEVNVANATTLGLVAQVKSDGAATFAPAFTGIASQTAVQRAIADHTSLENNVVFAMPNAALDTLANLLGMTSEQMVARGLLIGMTAGYPNEATAENLGIPPVVPGVHVTATQKDSEHVSVYYPNEDYTSLSQDGGTNSDGMFLVLGDGTHDKAFTTTLEMHDPSGAHVWHPQMAGVGPSFTLITVYPAI